MKEANKCF